MLLRVQKDDLPKIPAIFHWHFKFHYLKCNLFPNRGTSSISVCKRTPQPFIISWSNPIFKIHKIHKFILYSSSDLSGIPSDPFSTFPFVFFPLPDLNWYLHFSIFSLFTSHFNFVNKKRKFSIFFFSQYFLAVYVQHFRSLQMFWRCIFLVVGLIISIRRLRLALQQIEELTFFLRPLRVIAHHSRSGKVVPLPSMSFNFTVHSEFEASNNNSPSQTPITQMIFFNCKVVITVLKCSTRAISSSSNFPLVFASSDF